MIICDNTLSAKMARNPVFHTRTKHIEIMYHFIRERVMSNEINIKHKATQDQTVDILTKALPL
jgi:hypothetical protein